MRWLRVPSGLLDLRPALGTAVWIYLHMVRSARKDGTIPDWSDLEQGNLIGLSRWAVRDARRKLRRYGLITQVRTPANKVEIKVIVPAALVANPSQAPWVRALKPTGSPRTGRAPKPSPLPQSSAPAPGHRPEGGDRASWTEAWSRVVAQVVDNRTRPQIAKALQSSEIEQQGDTAIVRVSVSTIDEIAGTSWLQQFLAIRCGRLLAQELSGMSGPGYGYGMEEISLRFIGPGDE